MAAAHGQDVDAFSPRERRCFLPKHSEAGQGNVFSAQAEVFLRSALS